VVKCCSFWIGSQQTCCSHFRNRKFNALLASNTSYLLHVTIRTQHPIALQVLAANQSPAGSKWFQGTADAVRQYLWLFENSMREGIEDFLILAGRLEWLLEVLTLPTIFT